MRLSAVHIELSSIRTPLAASLTAITTRNDGCLALSRLSTLPCLDDAPMHNFFINGISSLSAHFCTDPEPEPCFGCDGAACKAIYREFATSRTYQTERTRRTSTVVAHAHRKRKRGTLAHDCVVESSLVLLYRWLGVNVVDKEGVWART